MKPFSPKRSSGAAALLFLLIFPALFAVYVWGLEGARMMQTSARLTDATESAALAVSTVSNLDNTKCSQLTQLFVAQYFPESAAVTAGDSPCISSDNPNDLNISVSVAEQTWFPNAQIPNYGTQFSVSSSVKVRKTQEPVDVVLVASYSKTMLENEKVTNMTTTMNYIADELKAFNDGHSQKSTMGVVGFDRFTSELGTERYGILFPRERTVRLFSHNLLCEEYGASNYLKERARLCLNWNGSINEVATLDAGYVDAAGTVNNIFNEEIAGVSSGGASFLSRLFEVIFEALSFIFEAFGTRSPFQYWSTSLSSYSLYETLQLTQDIDGIKGVIGNEYRFNVNPNGVYGASYTGLIEGARVVNKGTNKRRLIILLTDGMEASPNVAQSLVNAGLCTAIRNKNIELAIIGFDYDNGLGSAMSQCVGDSNKYSFGDDLEATKSTIDGVLNVSSKKNSRLIN